MNDFGIDIEIEVVAAVAVVVAAAVGTVDDNAAFGALVYYETDSSSAFDAIFLISSSLSSIQRTFQNIYQLSNHFC